MFYPADVGVFMACGVTLRHRML